MAMSGVPLPILLVAALIGVAWAVCSCDRQSRKTLAAASRWRERPTMGDGEFLKACEIPNEPLMIDFTLAARRVIAELGRVPAETLRPDGSFAHDLVQLPYWDSLDWLDFMFRVERECRRIIARPVFDEMMRSSERWAADLQVRHVVRSLALTATVQHLNASLREE
jgi:hypothetical protein